MLIKDWNIEQLTGYEPKTTFYKDFSIADMYGESAIKETLENAKEYAKTDYKYYTELVMVLNWKIWEHYKTNASYGKLYNKLWETEEQNFFEYFDSEDATEYFFTTTD